MQPITDELIAKLEREVCLRTDVPGVPTYRGLWEVWCFYIGAKRDRKTYYDNQNMVLKAQKLLLDAKSFGILRAGVKAGVNPQLLPPELLDFKPLEPKDLIRTHSRTMDDPGGNRPRLILSAFERNPRRH